MLIARIYPYVDNIVSPHMIERRIISRRWYKAATTSAAWNGCAVQFSIQEHAVGHAPAWLAARLPALHRITRGSAATLTVALEHADHPVMQRPHIFLKRSTMTHIITSWASHVRHLNLIDCEMPDITPAHPQHALLELLHTSCPALLTLRLSGFSNTRLTKHVSLHHHTVDPTTSPSASRFPRIVCLVCSPQHVC